MTRSTRILLIGGIVAAPLFVAVWALQAVTRDGFRPTYHPLSLLSLGEGGWMQIANFVVTGLLLIGAGIGLRRTTRSIGSALLVGVMGAGLIVAGVFVTDAGAGFPEGAPDGAPMMSWHGAVHEVGFVLTQLAFVVVAIVWAVGFGRAGHRGWMIASILALLAAIGVAAVGSPDTLAIRLVASSAIELGLVAAVSGRALRTERA
jgi:hypothetical protein